jgi:hypothetical protein
LISFFTPAETAEIVCFCAWQFGGVRMTDSLGADKYPRTVPVQQADIPVRLPYFYDDHGEDRALSAQRHYNETPPSEIFARAKRTGSPPRLWLELLAANVPLLQNWVNLYWQVTEEGVLPARITQLVGWYMAAVVEADDWMAGSIAARRVSEPDRRSLAEERFDVFAPGERAALCYTQDILRASSVSDETFAAVSSLFALPEIIELSRLVAVQNGVMRVFRSLRDGHLSGGWVLTHPANW